MTDTKAEVLARAKLVVDGLFNFGPGLTEHDRIVFVAGVIDQAREEGRRDARVEDLLRDAERYQRLKRDYRESGTGAYLWPFVYGDLTSEEFDAEVDAEVAREKAGCDE